LSIEYSSWNLHVQRFLFAAARQADTLRAANKGGFQIDLQSRADIGTTTRRSALRLARTASEQRNASIGLRQSVQ